LEALLLLMVSFEKDISLALTNDLHVYIKAVLFCNQLKTVCVLYDVFSSNSLYIKLLSPEAVFHSKVQPKRWRLGKRIVALSPVFMGT